MPPSHATWERQRLVQVPASAAGPQTLGVPPPPQMAGAAHAPQWIARRSRRPRGRSRRPAWRTSWARSRPARRTRSACRRRRRSRAARRSRTGGRRRTRRRSARRSPPPRRTSAPRGTRRRRRTRTRRPARRRLPGRRPRRPSRPAGPERDALPATAARRLRDDDRDEPEDHRYDGPHRSGMSPRRIPATHADPGGTRARTRASLRLRRRGDISGGRRPMSTAGISRPAHPAHLP